MTARMIKRGPGGSQHESIYPARQIDLDDPVAVIRFLPRILHNLDLNQASFRTRKTQKDEKLLNFAVLLEYSGSIDIGKQEFFARTEIYFKS